ncbi:hypothetical protein D2T31_11795 [Sinirhodobacter populi]|uniref:Uncharacterized protein n=1 Tax=Paenirhodobacter populi TaxID=2306993 RepID=A0A443K929_9RHOB|nr:hypothetical protein [Sinirhodobacter populi]RWR29183.1 hypothetical protein D2T31_11795 [Sinirhodobacter populi]
MAAGLYLIEVKGHPASGLHWPPDCEYPRPYVAEVVRDVPVAVVDQEGSSASRDLIRRIDATDSTAVVAALSALPDAQVLFIARLAGVE